MINVQVLFIVLIFNFCLLRKKVSLIKEPRKWLFLDKTVKGIISIKGTVNVNGPPYKYVHP